MITYKAMYRCRLCGKAFYSGAETGERMARVYMNIAISGVHMENTTVPSMLHQHDCEEPYNGIGLADFIGFIAKEDDTNAKETD